MNVFRQHRTGRRARRLGLSQLLCPGRHTVTGLLCTCGRQFVDWSGDYRLFSKDRWNVRDLFAPIVEGILALLPAEVPFLAAMDDTHLPKTGTKMPGVAYRRDPLSPAFHVNFIRAQRFLQISGLLPAGVSPGPARAIPIRYEHVPPVPKPKKSAPPDVWDAYRQQRREQNLSLSAVRALHDVRQELDNRHDAPGRQFVVSVDGSYTNRTVLKALPERTTLIGRIRKDAELFHPPRAEDQPAVGSKRRYGQAAPTPEQLRQDETAEWQEVTAFAAGKLHTFRVKTIVPVLWKKAGADRPLRLVVIAPLRYRLRQNAKLLYRQPAYLICTDPALPLEQLVQYYLWRWDIEVNHRDEKQIVGVGEAQVWSPDSVDRQPALAVASYAILLLAGERAFGAAPTRGALPLPKWRHKRPGERLSTQELIQQLRSEVWAYAIDRCCDDSDHFVATDTPATKWPESQYPVASALLYATAG
jgi:hypothetical protein